MVDLILKAGYNYVSAVHTEGSYGASGMKVFLDLSEQVIFDPTLKISEWNGYWTLFTLSTF